MKICNVFGMVKRHFGWLVLTKDLDVRFNKPNLGPVLWF